MAQVVNNSSAVTFLLIDFHHDEKNSYLFSKLKETIHGKSGEIEEWLQALLIDINGDFDRFITDIHHPNHCLLSSKALKYHQDHRRYRNHRGEQWIHPQHGVVFEGAYLFTSSILYPPVELFNPSGFTLLLRVFYEKNDRGVVIIFDSGYKWFGIDPNGISLNNGNKRYLFSELKPTQWNDIWVSYNNIQPKYTFNESCPVFKNSNSKREILCIVNGVELHFDIPIGINVLALTDDGYIQNEMGIQFIDYSCANTLKGFFSSLVMFNQSCTSFDELKLVASTFLKNHDKPTLTYQELLQSKPNDEYNDE